MKEDRRGKEWKRKIRLVAGNESSLVINLRLNMDEGDMIAGPSSMYRRGLTSDYKRFPLPSSIIHHQRQVPDSRPFMKTLMINRRLMDDGR